MSGRNTYFGEGFTEASQNSAIRLSKRAQVLKCCFGKTRSRVTGALMRLQLPFRHLLFRSLLSRWCQDESELRDEIESFGSLSEFFSRRLKPSARPISSMDESHIIAPCDGTLVHYERIVNASDTRWLTQLKGAKYRIDKFLGRTLESNTECTDADKILSFEGRVRKCDVCGFPQVTVSQPRRQRGVRSEDWDIEPGLQIPKSKDSWGMLSTASHSTQDRTFDGSGGLGSPVSPFEFPSEISASVLPEIGLSEDPEIVWHYFVIYLSPSDYHHFHAPSEIVFHRRRHFAGEVMPVCRGVASRLNNLFAVNERVVLEGAWQHGTFFYVAISAYNVADIRLTFEPEFSSNLPRSANGPQRGQCHVVDYLPSRPTQNLVDSGSDPDCTDADGHHPSCEHAPYFGSNLIKRTKSEFHDGVSLRRGNEVGEFKLGSTVVLLFQGPPSLKVIPNLGEHLKTGEMLARISS
eukprot:Gregarina_sp_Poly_1__5557@NODE_2934_length_1535_cov_126_826294_g1850_i0_p1_GENE_NODE_2934_length_1535_cov_126_826294_g1850_i0NODE_2934_length_1535_cov_126_826294_g1850_i0_p1_ORF_typecomplete_len477_score45_07PS_Dcarbxylase/PF02666_15/1_4e51_NODE_2934_length_1535_cov_126_826294_g1850_i0421433